LVDDDIGDGVSCDLAGVDLNGGRCDAVHEGLDAEVEVLLRAGDRRAKVLIGCPNVDRRGIGSVDGDDWRGVGRCTPARRKFLLCAGEELVHLTERVKVGKVV
jgi:hypothetical protein